MFVTLLLAWFHGEKGRQGVSAVELSLPVPILALTAAGAFGALRDGGTGASTLKAAGDVRSVAVLPFVNLSGGAEAEWTHVIRSALPWPKAIRPVRESWPRSGRNLVRCSRVQPSMRF